MRSSLSFLAALLLLLPAGAQQYRVALPGYRYEFPCDHFSHPDFQTEWWYYTGNVRSADGHRFGFELTFFRQAVDRIRANFHVGCSRSLSRSSRAERFGWTRRSIMPNASIVLGPVSQVSVKKMSRIWNGNWQVDWKGEDETLQAIDNRFTLAVTLRSEKPPVIHGENGVSQKAKERAGLRIIFL